MSSTRKSICLCLLIAAFASFACSAGAGTYLDEFLNPITVDQDTGAASCDHPFGITSIAHLGQSFTTGPSVTRISRISIGVRPDNQWQSGESLVMTLYDGQRKENKLASCALRYEQRAGEKGVLVFPLNAHAQPDRHYYFELSVEGGDGELDGILASERGYSDGRAYVGGVETDSDLWFEVGVKRTWDRDAAYRSLFGNWNLDYPALERVKEACGRSDWDAAVEALVGFYDRNPSDLKLPIKDAELADYSTLLSSPDFDTDHRAVFILKLIDAAESLAAGEGQGTPGSLYRFAMDHSELKKWKHWFKVGRDGVVNEALRDVNPDGSPVEASVERHCRSISRLLDIVEESRKVETPVSKEAMAQIESMCEFVEYTIRPNGWLPAWGDSGLVNGVECLKRAAKVLDRPDFLYAATGGRERTPPPEMSKAFPAGGCYVMRSGWGRDDCYLAIRNGERGSRGHLDSLSLVLAAYGKDLVIDPGMNTLSPQADELSRTDSHSTITVDGTDTLPLRGKSLWKTGDMIDYYDGLNPGYEGTNGAVHRRRIVFIRPDYWVISDSVLGKGTHEVDSRFFFRSRSARIDPDTKCGRTVFMEGGSLKVVPVFTEGVDFHIDTGGACLGGDNLTPVPVYHASIKSELPITLGWVLIPYTVGKAPERKVAAKRIPLGTTGVFSVAVSGPGYMDGVAFGDGPDNPVPFDKGGGFAGDVLFGRTDGTGKLIKFAWVNGTNFQAGGMELVAAKKPVDMLEMELKAETLYVKASSPEPSLRISTKWPDGSRWFSRISVDGGAAVDVPSSGDYVRPYRVLSSEF